MGIRLAPSMTDVKKMKAKVALVGESSVGKTSLIRRFVRDEYDDKYLHTVGTKVTKIELTVPYGGPDPVKGPLPVRDSLLDRAFIG